MAKEKAKEKDKEIFEWYGAIGDQGCDSAIAPNQPEQGDREEPEEESPEKKVDKIEKSAELAKAMSLTKALDNKLALLSGVFSGFSGQEKVDSLKAEVKEIAKRILKIVSEEV